MGEEIQRWVRYMEEHPDSWKTHHTRFINAQFVKQQAFLERLSQQPKGKEKIAQMYGIKNRQGYPNLFLQE